MQKVFHLYIHKMELGKISSKKAAIELSIGTVVIVVLAMSMLILGLVLVKTIFQSATSSVEEIDQGVKNKINELFSENNEKRLVLFPDQGLIKLKQGSKGSGFALAIRNVDDANPHVYSYTITEDSVDRACGVSSMESYIHISAGSSSSGISLDKGHVMENPIHVRFSVSRSSPTCVVRYKIEVEEDGAPYTSGFMDVEIVRK